MEEYPEHEEVGEEADNEPSATPIERVSLPGISSMAYEHPADRAALLAMSKVPGFDLVLRKFIGLIGERRLRYLYLASAVRVNEKQFRKLNVIYEDCLRILDFPERPELFVAQTPFVNAGAMGVEKPFIVLNSGALALMKDEEVRYILGHELGHILSDHVLYKTMLALLLRLALVRLGIPIAAIALQAIIAALTEWDRKSELSADRAGLLCTQAPSLAYTVIMKMAGGRKVDEMDIDEFVRQAEEYEQSGDELATLLKIVNLIGRRHPFAVLRLAELKKWVDGGTYERILGGEYVTREQEDRASVLDQFKESAESYHKTYQESKEPLFQFIRELGDQVSETGANLWSRLKGAFGGREEGVEEEASEVEPSAAEPSAAEPSAAEPSDDKESPQGE